MMNLKRVSQFLRRRSRPIRLAYGRIFHEANAYSPLPTTREHFERFHYLEGDAVARASRLRTYELRGLLRLAELSGFVQAARVAGGVELVPLLSAFAVPGGPLREDTFFWLLERLGRALSSAGKVDGVYLALHGSMQAEGLDRAPEAVILEQVARTAPGAAIAASYDLHANLSAGLVDPCQIVTAYHSNPHWDLFFTGLRAGQGLIRCVRGQVTPVHAWRKLPMVLGGGLTIDFLQPMRPIFRRLRQLERDPRVVTANLFQVHPYTDAEDLGWAVHVQTNDDPALANQLADELANRVWAVRSAPLPPLRSIGEAVDEVRTSHLARKTGMISIVDVDDVVGTGASGGNTHLVDHLVRQPSGLRIYVPLHDPDAVELCWDRATGETVSLTLRGTKGLQDQPAVPFTATIKARAETDFGRTVRLDRDGLSVAISDRPPFSLPGFWHALGLSLWQADAVVQKSLFHYRIFYLPWNRKNIGVKSAGASSLDHVRKRRFLIPRHPNDVVDDWRPGDRALRAMAASHRPGRRLTRS